MVCVLAQLRSSPSVYLAEFLGFARLRPRKANRWYQQLKAW
jgi:hypothetical protein